MLVKLLPMELVRANIDLGPDYFTGEYPGSFLLPVGLLSNEEVPEPRAPQPPAEGPLQHQMTATYQVVEPADTLVMSFEDRLKHSMADHPLAGSVFFIRHIEAAPSLLIGRDPSCDLMIPEPSVSARHCEIVVDSKGNLVGADLGSTNGMSINLKRLAPGMPLIIADGDILTFGRYSFQYFHAQSLYDALQVVYG
jgi:hypothetical protein